MKSILYDWGGGNVWLFHQINDIHGPLLDRAMLLGTALGGHANFVTYLAIASFAAILCVAVEARRNPHQLERFAVDWLAVLAVFSIAYVLDGMLLGWLKPLLDFPRPPLALSLEAVHIVGTPEFHHSLPSGHSSFAMLVAASLWPVLNSSWRTAAALFVLWVGISRISLGAHFPADVLAGFLSGLLVVLVVRYGIQTILVKAGNLR
jgi:membrane-associated phospholipid phosphatase